MHQSSSKIKTFNELMLNDINNSNNLKIYWNLFGIISWIDYLTAVYYQHNKRKQEIKLQILPFDLKRVHRNQLLLLHRIKKSKNTNANTNSNDMSSYFCCCQWHLRKKSNYFNLLTTLSFSPYLQRLWIL